MDSVERNFSQAGQDLFVLSLLDGKRDGVFLDLGCGHPIVINNTFLLEKDFGWKGLCVDIDPENESVFAFRKTPLVLADCRRLDWTAVIDRAGTNSFDYLSLDLEPPIATLEGLRSIPFEEVTFSVVTFEHDAYRTAELVREPSRAILEEHGYVRLCSDVKISGLEFEDWYYNPNIVDPRRSSVLKSDAEEWENIIFDTE